MSTKKHLRAQVKTNLKIAIDATNRALTGRKLIELKPILERLGRGNTAPHWYNQLAKDGTLPNLDGKTIGSVIEMLFVAVLEKYVFKDKLHLHVNPASGVDLPDLDLGVKSPSKNYCVSEPFFSAYDRLLGSQYDIVAMLTDYQTSKLNPPLRLQIIESSYLYGHEVADRGLCSIARKHREWLISKSQPRAKKLMRFLAYANQSDWTAKWILKLVDHLQDDTCSESTIAQAVKHFKTTNKKRHKSGKDAVSDECLANLTAIGQIRPSHIGIIEAADNWVADTHQDFARLPNENEWRRLITSPLDGKIGMSYALQWRYNFGTLFRLKEQK